MQITLQPLVAEPRRVDVRAVDRELADLWRVAAEASEAERILLSRARTLTLVMHAADPVAAAQLSDIAARTCQRHPGRALVLVTDPAEADMVAVVNAICQVRRRDQKQVCCEQILIHAHPTALPRLPSLVRQFVLPDMPVALYWPAPPPDTPLFRELCDVADRVIVDTAAGPNGAGLLAAGRLAGAGGQAAPGDLSWGRIAAWRNLTAQFFDPPHTEALGRITGVRVGHAVSSRAQALLYAAWLAARLRWTVVEPLRSGAETAPAALTDGRGRPVTISLHPEARARHAAGALLSAKIETTGGDGRGGAGAVAFSITRQDDVGGLLAVTEGDGQSVRRALPIDSPDEAALLAGELDIIGRDRIYESTLRAVSALIGDRP